MNEKMLLVIDVGNTQTVFGLFLDSRLTSDWRINSNKGKSVNEYAGIIQKDCLAAGVSLNDIKAVVISSVVPLLQDIFETFCTTELNLSPLIVDEKINTGLTLMVDAPHEVGADRIVNTLAAYHLMEQACIVVDFGTATTFDCVSSKGEFLGGVIMPGIGISAEALFQSTSKLPRVEIVKPKSFIGKNTVHCMQAGIFLGYVAMVDGVVSGIAAEMNENAFVIATGGIAGVIAPDTKTIQTVDPYLTLKGLQVIYQLNQ